MPAEPEKESHTPKNVLDNQGDWVVTAPRTRKIMMLTGWAAMIALPFAIVGLRYPVSNGMAMIYATLASVVGVMCSIYTYYRGKQDTQVIDQASGRLADIITQKAGGLLNQEPQQGPDAPPPQQDGPPLDEDPPSR